MKMPSQELVDAFFAWFNSDPHHENEDHYVGVITREALESMTREAFIEFFYQFAHEGGKVQSGGYRTAGNLRKSIEADYEKFRSYVLKPFADDFDELEWLVRTSDFNGWGEGIATIYLNRIDKKRFAIVNKKAVKAVKLLGVTVPSNPRKKYEAIRQAWAAVIEAYPRFENFYRTDALSPFLIGEKEAGRPWKEQLEAASLSAKLGHPFDRLFTSRDEANTLFEAMRQGAEAMGIGPDDGDDPRLACTLHEGTSRYYVRLNYGNWAISSAIRETRKTLVFQYACRTDLIPDFGVRNEGGEFADSIEGENYVLVSVPADKANDETVLASMRQSFAGVARRFSEWAASPFRAHHRPALFAALFDAAARQHVLTTGIEVTEDRHWIYAPGEQARFWKEFHEGNVIGVGWDDLEEDLSKVDRKALRRLYDSRLGSRATNIDFAQLADFVYEMKEGDRVFVKRGRREIVGYGEVASDYFYDSDRAEYRHMRKARWLKTGSWKVPEGMSQLPMKTLTKSPSKSRTHELLALIDAANGKNPPVPNGAIFNDRSFTLLAELSRTPEAAFYQAHAAEFKEHVESPLRELMRAVAQHMPTAMLGILETESRLFSRILKNDYGRGGAWDYYWGAFYPKGGKRTASPQLFVSISGTNLRFGFYVGDYSPDSLERLSRNCQEHGAALRAVLDPVMSGLDLIFGEGTERKNLLPGYEVHPISWAEWLADPSRAGASAAIEIPPPQVLALSKDDLISRVAKTFIQLFPLLWLAQSDRPMSFIREFVGEAEEVAANPEYSVEELASAGHMEAAEIHRWIRAILRKKQAILYGPPGTGKTYLARLLAQHLVGGGQGFTETLQLHPSYAYEDFMQGLRPKSVKDGGLQYAMVPGRFKDFCERALSCDGTCVLVLDEINRANLAKVFGELMYLLEYRDEAVPLAGGEIFRIPANVILLGTMNTADRSIALVDHALRRRFAFLELFPNYDILRRYHAATGFAPEGLIGVLERLNAAIQDRHYSVGVSFFLNPDIRTQIEDIWRMEVAPYVEELFFDNAKTAQEFGWEQVASKILG